MQFFSFSILLCAIMVFPSSVFAKNQQNSLKDKEEPVETSPYNTLTYFKGCTFYFENEHLNIKTVEKVIFSTSILRLYLKDIGLKHFNVPQNHIIPILNSLASKKKDCSRKLRHRM